MKVGTMQHATNLRGEMGANQCKVHTLAKWPLTKICPVPIRRPGRWAQTLILLQGYSAAPEKPQ